MRLTFMRWSLVGLLVFCTSTAFSKSTSVKDSKDKNKNEEGEKITEAKKVKDARKGKRLEQIEEQLNHKLLMENYDLNLRFGLRKIGLKSAISSVANETERIEKAGHDYDFDGYELPQYNLKEFSSDYGGEEEKEVCYDDIGCIDVSEKWYGLQRPVNLLPLERNVINTRFILRTRGQGQDIVLKASKIDTIKEIFDPKKNVKFIVHGFIDTGFDLWLKDMASAMLSAEDCNVFAVDWGGGSLPMYHQATANTRVVGLELAYFINQLISKFGMNSSQFHLIGHSLGAHICGYAGEKVKGLGRITGLDPAEPLFQDLPEFVRLDPSDAEFVDAIHTDAKSIVYGGYGMLQPVGHIDFYPNGGKIQPGCSLSELSKLTQTTINNMTRAKADQAGRRLAACNHNRAVELFTDSARNAKVCPLVGHKCKSYDKYQAAECYSCGVEGENCAIMGFFLKKHKLWDGKKNWKFYLSTDSFEPFCLHSYLVGFHIGAHADLEFEGNLIINITGTVSQAKGIFLTPSEPDKFKRATVAKYLVSFRHKGVGSMGEVKAVDVHWEHIDKFMLGPIDASPLCIFFCTPTLYTDRITVTYPTVSSSWEVTKAEVSLCPEEMKQDFNILGKLEYAVKTERWRSFDNECQAT